MTKALTEECWVGPDEVSFRLKLYNDDSVATKLRFMNEMECMFDDQRNDVPDSYYDLINGLELGEQIEIKVRKLDKREI
jgi:hypothetical protein